MTISASTKMLAMLAVALLVVAARVADAQPDCASNLVPCADYLNSTNPSKECCDAIKTVITTQLPCLCGLIKNPGALAGINLTQALELPKHCNLPSDTSVCNDAQAPASSSLPPPATPGESGAGMVSLMGMPLLLFASALTFLY